MRNRVKEVSNTYVLQKFKQYFVNIFCLLTYDNDNKNAPVPDEEKIIDVDLLNIDLVLKHIKT